MKKAMFASTFALLVLFSMLAVIPAPVHAATNDRIGNFTILDQNYTVKGITNNMFLANYLASADVQNSTLTYDSTKKAVKYHVWPGNNMYLFIGDLAPAVKATYTLRLSMATDNYNAATNIYIGQAWINFKFADSAMTQYSIKLMYYNATGGILNVGSTIAVPSSGYVTLNIEWNGVNKTVHLTCAENKTVNLWAPAAYYDVQKIPYNALAWTYVNIKVITSLATYADVYLYELKQTVPRYTITALPRWNLQPFGFDGPHDFSTVQKGMEYLQKYGYRATLFFDVGYQWYTNATVKKYYLDLINNKSWEPGIHYSKQLTTLSWANATANMTKEYNEVKTALGVAPTSWCSLTNADNISHAQYAWNNFKMYWRNGAIGINSISNIGGLNNDSWHFWDIASQHGFVYPAFTHETDNEPAALHSIDYSKFTTWVDRAKSHGIQIVPFIDYFKINLNQVDFYATDIQSSSGYFKFVAHTNGEKAYVDVNFKATTSTIVRDLTTGKIIKWYPGSVQFWVEDGHTYEIIDTVAQSISTAYILFNTALGMFIVVSIILMVFGMLATASRKVQGSFKFN